MPDRPAAEDIKTLRSQVIGPARIASARGEAYGSINVAQWDAQALTSGPPAALSEPKRFVLVAPVRSRENYGLSGGHFDYSARRRGAAKPFPGLIVSQPRTPSRAYTTGHDDNSQHPAQHPAGFVPKDTGGCAGVPRARRRVDAAAGGAAADTHFHPFKQLCAPLREPHHSVRHRRFRG